MGLAQNKLQSMFMVIREHVTQCNNVVYCGGFLTMEVHGKEEQSVSGFGVFM